ncbi:MULTISPECIES: pyrroline-5-carboxylate reductase [unclassified Herbaspirillum]|uniref:pyrroline-5-carboxylate reductase n=1 Tax=unclassified Herbaspirillum TaxID=2624150 RepID=UPI000E2EF6C0|nr:MULTISPECIES: pyrroline-5-carboxylate reductase [unclassified Herbaspirillum]RFB71332.1 pyrroline-5-carboxylate reductase [Herbaspirillum sp. 3R-3a1]TFI08284.1 pyrroline-5-carboxylate reductase [Herbaspirillum sp. 3R11]TFI14699.1 pyrroline-5-carboxylate reductase [Herbaspirillum sp. 3R-11]TFI31909.1 pyrroline-5-carboxylate reductase [Herbaspirillum sp. 3C11]TFI32008.1 pyrroline-5-carboxylate reductase [Herbaspirillum sp. 3C11]
MKITFIGGGNMAAAIIGSLAGRVVSAQDIHVIDLNATSLAALHEKYGVSTSPAIDKKVADCDVIVLAVKPDHVKDVLSDITPFLHNQLIISIAAGVRISEISKWSKDYKKIVRAMPNTPALIVMGMTGLYAAPSVSPEQKESADAIMKAVGTTVWLDNEEKIDAVTAISGSGPAYVFYFVEAMQQAALELGLSESDATLLSLATFRGASELATRSDELPSQLRAKVTSKGGTTHAAISAMETSNIKPLIVEAIKAAARRSQEIGDEWSAKK